MRNDFPTEHTHISHTNTKNETLKIKRFVRKTLASIVQNEVLT